MSKSSRGSRLGMARGERYALIPEEVMESTAFHAQPDWARCVLFALACRFNGHSNGDISLPFSEAKRLGITAQWKLYAGLRLLEWAGLIICTRRGRLEKGKKLPSLYALTWRGINECDGIQFDAGVGPCPLPSHDWARWAKPADWAACVRQVSRLMKGRSDTDSSLVKTARLRKSPHTHHGGEGRSHHGGAMPIEIAPTTVEKESGFLAPTMVDASKTPGLGHRGPDAAAGAGRGVHA